MSDWNVQANEIFLRAAELSDRADRARFVEECCDGDLGLLECVNELLAASDDSGDFLEAPLAQLPPEIMGTLSQYMPEQVGRYKILEELGEGGMGVVYRAKQQEPVRRLVALKIIKPGLDTRQVIARFETERQVLALMDHPGIARVLDAGATDAGRPYFVMELVSGVPITTYCDQEELSRRERLELLIDVCHAVLHAHQKGIIHRDLKPSNILVTRQDDRAVVKVIDFGVAKAIGQHGTEGTLTGVAQWVGTPLYMSPEQASPIPIDIDTRSDVYSLGVLLYELLTGTTPFNADTIGRTDESGKRRLILEYDPPFPSTRVATLDTRTCHRLGAGDRIDGRRLSRQLKGELDWIVMKALEKDRERRYETIGALAADLKRYLSDEPVQAGPPSRLYRIRKLAWRNRGALTTGLAVALALVVGTAVSIWQAIEANRARSLADSRYEQTQQALHEANLSRVIADVQRDRAQASESASKRLLYASDMRLAVDAWKENDVRRMREILDRHASVEAGATDHRGFEWHYLKCLTGVPSKTLLQSPAPLYALTLSPDGRLLATAGAHDRVHLFDTATQRQVREFDTHQIEVNALEFSPDSRTLYTGGDDGSVALWNVQSGALIRRFEAQHDAVFGLALLPERGALLTGGRDNILRIWDAETLRLRESISKHTNTIQAIAASGRGLVAVGSDDFHVTAWDGLQNVPIWSEADQPTSRVNTIAFSPEGSLLATGHVSGMLTIRDGATGAQRGQQVFPDSIHSLAFAPVAHRGAATNWIAIGDRWGSVYLLPTGMFVQHDGLLPRTSFDRSRQWPAHEGRLYGLAFSADGTELFTVGEDGLLKVWDYETSNHARRLPFPVQHLSLIGSDRVATIFNKVRISSLADGQTLYERALPEAASHGDQIRFDRHANQIYFLANNRHIYVLPGDPPSGDAPAPRLLYRSPPDSAMSHIGVSQHSGRLAAQFRQAVDFEAVSISYPLEPELPSFPTSSAIHQIRFGPDGSVVFDQVKDLLFVHPETGTVVKTLSGHISTINDFAFSPDDQTVATASSDRTVRIWDWKAEQELWRTTAHENEVSSVAYSPDGETLATAGSDGALRLWRWKHNTLVLEIRLLDWPVSNMSFNENGRKLIVHADNGVRIYDSEPEPGRFPQVESGKQ